MFPQGQTLEVLQDVAFKPLSGRKVSFKQGDLVCVTNPRHKQEQDGLVQIGRKGKAKINQGWYLNFEIIKTYFKTYEY